MDTSLSSEMSFVKLLETLPDPRESWKVRAHALDHSLLHPLRGFVWSGRLAGCRVRHKILQTERRACSCWRRERKSACVRLGDQRLLLPSHRGTLFLYRRYASANRASSLRSSHGTTSLATLPQMTTAPPKTATLP